MQFKIMHSFYILSHLYELLQIITKILSPTEIISHLYLSFLFSYEFLRDTINNYNTQYS